MITNERQYLGTLEAIRNFEEGLASPEEEFVGLAPHLRERARSAMQGELEMLRSLVTEYEKLRDGRTLNLGDDLRNLGQLLIKARIAQSLTQKDLAERVGIKEQQIQRYEARLYQSASLARIKGIIEALDIQANVIVSLRGSESVVFDQEVVMSTRRTFIGLSSPGLSLSSTIIYQAGQETDRSPYTLITSSPTSSPVH